MVFDKIVTFSLFQYKVYKGSMFNKNQIFK